MRNVCLSLSQFNFWSIIYDIMIVTQIVFLFVKVPIPHVSLIHAFINSCGTLCELHMFLVNLFQ